MIDHINIPVTDLDRARAFYDAVLATFNLEVVAVDGPAVGYGQINWTFGIIAEAAPILPLHVAFAAKSHEQVDAFYKAALASGGTSNGAPGERPDYGAGYYSAYILDHDGHNIEAVYRP